jgi:hypothetical protein
MVPSKLDVAVVAVLAVGMLWIEHEHRTVVATPAAAEVAPSAASVCPDTDDVPFSADCIALINGGALSEVSSRSNARPLAPAPDTQHAELRGPACPPSNENAPYSADCLKFLSGWYWQANPTQSTP